jgi:hypothetical protein
VAGAVSPGPDAPGKLPMCPAYIAGLIGPGDRKSIQPLAARTDDVGYDQLHHFIASGIWDAASFKRRLLSEADRLVGDVKGYLGLAGDRCGYAAEATPLGGTRSASSSWWSRFRR